MVVSTLRAWLIAFISIALLFCCATAAQASTLSVAQSQLGNSESPLGSNSGPAIDKYRQGAPVAPWSGYFTTWVLAQNGVTVPTAARGSVTAFRSWAKKAHRYHTGLAGVHAGDVLVLSNNGLSGIYTTSSSSKVILIAGNVNNKVDYTTFARSAVNGYFR